MISLSLKKSLLSSNLFTANTTVPIHVDTSPFTRTTYYYSFPPKKLHFSLLGLGLSWFFLQSVVQQHTLLRSHRRISLGPWKNKSKKEKRKKGRSRRKREYRTSISSSLQASSSIGRVCPNFPRQHRPTFNQQLNNIPPKNTRIELNCT